MIKLHDLTHPVFDILSNYKGKEDFYVCGGYVRNILIGGDGGKDIDVFVKCTNNELSSLVQYLNNYGRIDYGQYGSPRFYPSADSGCYVDIVPFYNFVVSTTPIHSVEELLCNFDFTANAIGISLKTGRFYNPLHGTDDIKNRILRAVRLDFPERPVSESIGLSAVSVFWFRLLHYQQKLNFIFDQDTEKWILENAFRIRDLEAFEQNFFSPLIGYEIKQEINRCLLQRKTFLNN